jgi:RimJ/RimL family protein N-acetyltransferase
MINLVEGRNINFELVGIKDAKFILDLRLANGNYLSETENDINKQIEWIKAYKERESRELEFYFIIKDKKNRSIGVIRIYDIDYSKKTFTFGSFIIDSSCGCKYAALESMTMLLEHAFNQLGLKTCFFDCRIGNDIANKFYIRYGAKLINKDDLNYYYKYDKEFFNKESSKYYQIINK